MVWLVAKHQIVKRSPMALSSVAVDLAWRRFAPSNPSLPHVILKFCNGPKQWIPKHLSQICGFRLHHQHEDTAPAPVDPTNAGSITVKGSLSVLFNVVQCIQ